MCKAIKLAEKLSACFTEIEEEIKRIERLIRNTDMETQDILHDIELTNFNASEGYMMAKKIQEIRYRRREYKDEMETLDLLKGFTGHYKDINKGLMTIVKTIKKREEELPKRSYKPRVRKDLKLVTDKLNKVNQTKQLQQVNKTNIKFHPEVDRIEALLSQVQ